MIVYLKTFLFFLLFYSSLYTEQKVVLITGATSGVGLATAKVFHQAGWKVWAGYRNKPGEDDFRWVALDVRKDDMVEKAISTLLEEEGKIDVLINNAGYGVIGAEETNTMEQAKDQFEVLFFGPLRLIQAVAPTMRHQQSGHIINISGVCGVRALPGLGVYSAAKFALEGMSESLAVTLSPWNVKVSIVEAGSINSQWVNNATMGLRDCDEPFYTQLSESLIRRLSHTGQLGQDTKEIGELILKIAQRETPDLRYQSSAKAKVTAAKKLVDPTGNQMRKEQIDYFYSLVGEKR
jgi:NAD(P)-dependent dehydrogenase (short-subunit alcohol dehydrogenase family)